MLFGFAYMAGVPDNRALLGAFFAAIGITFFGWVAVRTGL
jgi:hypothetical protein